MGTFRHQKVPIFEAPSRCQATIRASELGTEKGTFFVLLGSEWELKIVFTWRLMQKRECHEVAYLWPVKGTTKLMTHREGGREGEGVN
ncbi:hypothetical protein GW17_00009660 [Ensete ventricosum]|uniref:Uncharacterized protein n=1 Tax=Ensete ventricosum TaxID=4639 RepID=A0A427B4L2_ENSVE|nr:hypothetical protein B296_00001794 [Ensete ventricosum]RWW25978.1 hypothetical protein GW17_00009660 [Ensete ventricosum]RZS02279.1 hypothetical protein BHM03_00032307 [Ensete ventricosum]